jgi:hypothetical protein
MLPIRSAAAGNKTDGTPWRALLFNDKTGFFQALIVEAFGEFTVSGTPDKVGSSDLLAAVKKLGEKAVNPEIDSRVTANTNRSLQNGFDINVIEQILPNLVHEAPNDGRIYGRKNKGWIEAGAAFEAFKFFSKRSIMITNTRIADRRKKGWDLGVPYLNENHGVYHFDTDLNNQNQGSDITLGYSGDAPVFVSGEDRRGDLFYIPAVYDVLAARTRALRSKDQGRQKCGGGFTWE